MRILIVDDDELALESLGGLLELEGHEVVLAASGRDGLARVAERRPDVIVTDLLMPDLDGLELVRAARRLDPTCGFVLLSGCEPDLAVRAGAPTVRKPVRLPELLAAIADAAMRRPSGALTPAPRA